MLSATKVYDIALRKNSQRSHCVAKQSEVADERLSVKEAFLPSIDRVLIFNFPHLHEFN